MIKFSVITVCFNDLVGLKNTYASLIEQEYKNFEWIVVDGASKDGTSGWLESLTESWINWISEPDKGIFDAMNKGIERSAGDFLVFMNSSDLFTDKDVLNDISGALNASENKDVAFIYGDSIDILENGAKLYRKAKDVSTIVRGMFTQHQSMYFRKSYMNDLKYSMDYPITADYAFIGAFIYSLSPKNILRIDKPLCKFMLGGTNEQKRFKGLKEDYKIRRKVFRVSAVKALVLFVLHLIHTTMKRMIPDITRKLRYS
jgi:putative colanic acid biosynthesis glycosyltransferase